MAPSMLAGHGRGLHLVTLWRGQLGCLPDALWAAGARWETAVGGARGESGRVPLYGV